jgi:hypothetical protein
VSVVLKGVVDARVAGRLQNRIERVKAITNGSSPFSRKFMDEIISSEKYRLPVQSLLNLR